MATRSYLPPDLAATARGVLARDLQVCVSSALLQHGGGSRCSAAPGIGGIVGCPTLTLKGSGDGSYDDHARQLLCEMLRLFYAKGWVSGTGGGICGFDGKHRLLVAPTGMHKETLRPGDFFVIDPASGDVLQPADEERLRPSECAGVFCTVIGSRDAGAVMHSHALDAVLAADLGDEWLTLRGFEMLKGIPGVVSSDEHRVPIIENTPRETELVQGVERALADVRFAETYAVLVRDHGAYIWGRDIWETKKHAEVYHWLFEAVRARRS